MSGAAPAFPSAGGALMPLRSKAEARGDDGFMNLWAGQAVGIKHSLSAEELTRTLAIGALERLAGR